MEAMERDVVPLLPRLLLPQPPARRQSVITVRLPVELHRELLEEAHRQHLSLNKLCIARLREHSDPEPCLVAFPAG